MFMRSIQHSFGEYLEPKPNLNIQVQNRILDFDMRTPPAYSVEIQPDGSEKPLIHHLDNPHRTLSRELKLLLSLELKQILLNKGYTVHRKDDFVFHLIKLGSIKEIELDIEPLLPFTAATIAHIDDLCRYDFSRSPMPPLVDVDLIDLGKFGV